MEQINETNAATQVPKAVYFDSNGKENSFDVKLDQMTNNWYYIDPKDQVKYEFDSNTNAWFPMFDQDLVLAQQSIYDVDEPQINKEEKSPVRKGVKNKKKNNDVENKPKERINSSVYVTGLPPDATFEELKETFSKCGLFMEDLATGKPKIKLYKDENGKCKGDALITFFKEESVQLATSLLDEAPFRPPKPDLIYVQKADFSKKEHTDNSNEAKKNKIDPKILKKRRQNMERKLDWYEKEEKSNKEKFRKTVLLKHMFSLQELEDDPALILDLKEDIREECSKIGEVTNVILYDKSEEGACTVRFREVLSADACIKLMNNRFFGGRRIEASIYDGAKYQRSDNRAMDDEEEKARLDQFGEWLEKK